jgi:hypothetical protein
MKNLNLSIALFLAFAFTACTSSEDNQVDPNTSSGEIISAKIDGVYWESKEGIAAYVSSDKTLNLAGGTINKGYSLYGGIKKPVTTGTYDIVERGDLTLNFNGVLYLAGVNVFNGKKLGSGTISVKEINNNGDVRATFEAIVEDGSGKKINITEGKISSF